MSEPIIAEKVAVFHGLITRHGFIVCATVSGNREASLKKTKLCIARAIDMPYVIEIVGEYEILSAERYKSEIKSGNAISIWEECFNERKT